MDSSLWQCACKVFSTVLRKEKGSIFKARMHDSLIARYHGVNVSALKVDNGDKGIGQCVCVPVVQR